MSEIKRVKTKATAGTTPAALTTWPLADTLMAKMSAKTPRRNARLRTGPGNPPTQRTPPLPENLKENQGYTQLAKDGKIKNQESLSKT